MPLTHELRDRAIWIITRGDVVYEDGLSSVERALEAARERDPDIGWDIVFDIRDSRENRSAAELERIAELVDNARPLLSGRCAVIAGSDYLFGVSRMFQAYCELRNLDSIVVRDPGELQDW